MDNLHQIFFSWLTASLKLLIKTSVVRFSYERNVFFPKIFSLSAHWRNSKLTCEKQSVFFFFSTKGVESYDTYFCCSFNVVWGSMLHLSIVNTGNFSQPKGSCAAHFSLSYFYVFFFLKSVGCLQVGYRFIPSMATICRSLSNQSNQSLPDRALESEQWHTESTCSLLFAAFFEVSLLQSGCIPYACQSRSIS